LTAPNCTHGRDALNNDGRWERVRVAPRGGVSGGQGQAEGQTNTRMKISAMSQNNRDDRRDDSGTGIVTKAKTKTKKPSLYRVLLLNDDYTPMEFVV